jgi:hypothetical protein
MEHLARIERFAFLRAGSCPVLAPHAFLIDITQNVNLVLFGINYRFMGGGPSY